MTFVISYCCLIATQILKQSKWFQHFIEGPVYEINKRERHRMKEDEKKEAAQSSDGSYTAKTRDRQRPNNNLPKKSQQQKKRGSRQDSFRGNHTNLQGHVYSYDGYVRTSQEIWKN